MSVKTAPILVFDVEAGEERQAELLYHLSYRDLESIDSSWKPYLEAAMPEIAMRRKSRRIIPDTIGWNWVKKLRVAVERDHNWEFYGIRYNEVLQGAIVLDLTAHPCAAEVHRGESSVCVEFIATAPWNYAPLMDGLGRRRFLKSVGPKLLQIGISVSRNAYGAGRLTLYSVPNPDTLRFYEQVCGMINLGKVEYHGELLYRFEMTSDQADRFIRGS